MKCMAQKTSFAQLLLFFTVSRRANNNTLPSFSMCFKFLRSLFFPRANGFQLLFLSLLSNGTFRSCYFSLHFSSEYQMRHEKWQQESIRVKIVIFAETNNTVREQKTRRWKKIGKENEAKAEVTQIRGLLCFYSDYILNGQHCVPLSWKCHDTGALNLDKDSTKLLTECNTTEWH